MCFVFEKKNRQISTVSKTILNTVEETQYFSPSKLLPTRFYFIIRN